jgi:hypothetical protein
MALFPLRRLAGLILLAASCSSPAGPGSNFVPGTTGTGGSVVVGGSGGLNFGGMGGSLGGSGGLSFGGMGGVSPGGSGGGLSKPDGGPGPDGAAPDGGSGAIGDKCTTGASCGPGGLCAADVGGGGYCTADCTTSGVCPAGATCAPASDTLKICLKTCAQSSHCRPEHVCLQGLCLPRCTKDSDCESGSCDVASGQCGASKVGNGCTSDTQCGAAPAFCDTSVTGGYCSRPCGGPMNVTCPDNANCISGGGSGVCLKSCATPTDCRASLLCADLSGAKSCIPRCAKNEDCGPGSRCEVATGACVAGPAPGTVGGPCTGPTDCAGLGAQAFCAPATSGFPGGYCSAACENATCVAPGLCVPSSATESNCLAPCDVPADCRSGYTCLAFQSTGVCLPKCTSDTDCRDPEPVCDLSTGYCAPRSTGGMGMTTGDTINLTPNGPINVDGVTLSDRLVLTMPADAVSVTFVGEAVSDPKAMITIARIEQTTDDFATSTRLFEYGSINNVIRVAPPIVEGAFSVLYPNSPASPFKVSTGTTTVKLGIRLDASGPTTVKVTALLKRAPTPVVTQGQIDLNLFFVGVPGLTAATAQTNQSFQQIFAQVKTIWGKVGVSVGNVGYFDLSPADTAQFSDLDENDLGALMTRSKVATRDNAMNVFFVNTINGDILAGYVILGVSSGLPGAPIRGTTASGLAVTMADFPQGLGLIAETWAHEGGHNLGLFHTSESSGTAFDPLPDTAECSRARDANGNRVLEANECQGAGADNLMFWTTNPTGLNTTLTPNQGFVILRDPVVH